MWRCRCSSYLLLRRLRASAGLLLVCLACTGQRGFEWIHTHAAAGDIILTSGTSMRARMVALFDTTKAPFTHAGLIVLRNHSLQVVHASPLSNDSSRACVQIEPLADFLGGDIEAARLLRYEDAHLTRKAVRYALLQVGKPFDHSFDLHSDSTLYCTELLWLAFRTVGIDLFPQGPRLLRAPLFHKHVLFPSQISVRGMRSVDPRS